MFNSTLAISDAVGVLVDRPSDLRSDFRPKGRFQVEHLDKNGNLLGVYDVPNGITDEGLNHILETEFHGGTPVTTWYIGLLDNASFSALVNADIMTSHAGWIENSGYSNATRVAWTPGAAATRSITNATTDDFNINATNTIKGIFIVSDNAKGGTAGKLWSTAAFGSTVPVNSGDTLKITYTVSG
jgi:hypothetical protein